MDVYATLFNAVGPEMVIVEGKGWLIEIKDSALPRRAG